MENVRILTSPRVFKHVVLNLEDCKTKKELTAYQKNVVELAVNSFGFLVTETVTPAEFADKICQVYSLENPKTKECVRVLRMLL